MSKTLATDTLDITYADAGPPDAPVVLLLPGWPDNASNREVRRAGFKDGLQLEPG